MNIKIVQLVAIIIKIMRVLKLQWWIYCVIAMIIFFLCLFLDFIVKKFNEMKLDKRCNRLEEKALSNQFNQVNSTSFTKLKNVEDSKDQNISLVFDRDKNMSSKANTEKLNEISFAQDTVTIGKADFKNMEAGNLQALSIKNSIDGNIREKMQDIKHNDDIKVFIVNNKIVNNSSHKLNIQEDLTEDTFEVLCKEMVINNNESKLTPSVNKLIEVQNEEELRVLVSDITGEDDLDKK